MALPNGPVTAVRQAIYQKLAGDVDVVALLATLPDGRPAILMGLAVPERTPMPYLHLGRPMVDAEDSLTRPGTIQIHDLRLFHSAAQWEAADNLADHIRQLFHCKPLPLPAASRGGVYAVTVSGPVHLESQPDTIQGSVITLTVNHRE